MIYLDNNATTKVTPEVVDAMSPFWSDSFFNPTSPAAELCEIRKSLDLALQNLAALLGASPSEFTLTSGATEANNWALQAAVAQALESANQVHILVSAIEHPSILETAKELARRDGRINLEMIPVTQIGIIDLEAMRKLLRSETALISVMFANNESGVIQPVSDASRLAKEIAPGCIFHSDATQAIGKLDVNLDSLRDVDLLSLSAHKFHGPKGIGALFIRTGTQLREWMIGGGQQAGRRAGTENPGAAAGLAKAVELLGSINDREQRENRIRTLRNQLEDEIREILPDVLFLGCDAPRLANTVLLVFPETEGEMIVHLLLEEGILVSTGASCSNGSDTPSHVVLSMGVEYSIARNALRISLSKFTTNEEIECVLNALERILGKL